MRKLRQNTQKIANFLRYYGKIHSKLTIFCVKSVKIYTGQKKFTRTCSWGSWQISGMKIPFKWIIHSQNTLSIIVVFAQSPKSVERAVFSLKVREHIRSQGPLLLEIWIGQQQIFCIKADSGKTYQIFHLLINSGEQSPCGKAWWSTKCGGGTQAPLASRGSVSPEEVSRIKRQIDLRTPLVGLLACCTFIAEC